MHCWNKLSSFYHKSFLDHTLTTVTILGRTVTNNLDTLSPPETLQLISQATVRAFLAGRNGGGGEYFFPSYRSFVNRVSLSSPRILN